MLSNSCICSSDWGKSADPCAYKKQVQIAALLVHVRIQQQRSIATPIEAKQYCAALLSSTSKLGSWLTLASVHLTDFLNWKFL